MKLIATLTLAAFMSSAAFAATTPTATPATATPAPAPAAAPAKHLSKAHCEKEAKAKKLMGDEEKKFVKDCEAGKS